MLHGTGIFAYIYYKLYAIHVGKYTTVPWSIWERVKVFGKFQSVVLRQQKIQQTISMDLKDKDTFFFLKSAPQSEPPSPPKKLKNQP